MKTPFEYVWTTISGEAYEGKVSTVAEAYIIMEQASSTPTIVEFYDPPTGLSFTIGVGSKISVICFEASHNPPYYISIGDLDASGVVEFVYGNEPTEYCAYNIISRETAYDALEWFFEHRTQPPFIRWEKL